MVLRQHLTGEVRMKKWVMLLVFCSLAGLLYCGGETETGEINYLVLDWEKIIEEAQKKAVLTFYHLILPSK